MNEWRNNFPDFLSSLFNYAMSIIIVTVCRSGDGDPRPFFRSK